MPVANATRETVERYFAAWTTQKVDEAYGLLAADLEFTGPNAHFHSAAAFRPGLEGFASLTRWAKIIELLVDGDRAALLYDCELPAPVGVIRIASFFRVQRGAISSYDTRFDAEDFRKLLSALPALSRADLIAAGARAERSDALAGSRKHEADEEGAPLAAPNSSASLRHRAKPPGSGAPQTQKRMRAYTPACR